jgi:hypothetical protein
MSNSVQNLAIEFQDREASEDDSFTFFKEPSIIEHKGISQHLALAQKTRQAASLTDIVSGFTRLSFSLTKGPFAA